MFFKNRGRSAGAQNATSHARTHRFVDATSPPRGRGRFRAPRKRNPRSAREERSFSCPACDGPPRERRFGRGSNIRSSPSPPWSARSLARSCPEPPRLRRVRVMVESRVKPRDWAAPRISAPRARRGRSREERLELANELLWDRYLCRGAYAPGGREAGEAGRARRAPRGSARFTPSSADVGAIFIRVEQNTWVYPGLRRCRFARRVGSRRFNCVDTR